MVINFTLIPFNSRRVPNENEYVGPNFFISYPPCIVESLWKL